MSDDVTGRCLCGAVSFTVRDAPDTYGICHCEMCRRWHGTSSLGVDVPQGNVDWSGEDKIAVRQSSAIAERAWCRACGASLWFRITADNEWAGTYDIPLGLFDDPDRFRLSHEIYIDHAPKGVAFADQGHKRITRAECVEKLPALDEI